jgi:hypothetical protein
VALAGAWPLRRRRSRGADDELTTEER